MRFKLWYFLFFTVIVACNRTLTSNNSGHRDSLQVSNSDFEVEGKVALLHEYYLNFGIAIPKLYVVKDSVAIDLNNDKLVDTLVVFSPVLLEDQKYSNFKSESYPNRLLVEILNKGTESKIRNTYEHVISSSGGVLSKYSGITLTENGFSIAHQSGSRYSWTVISEFSTGKDSLILAGFKKICSLEGLEDSVEYKLNKSMRELNINDTIQNNCNCDSMWKVLEGRLEKEN